MFDWLFWQAALAGPVNIAAFFCGVPYVRWFSLALGILLTTLFVTIEASNIAAGCYPWSPKIVAFHQGMTLCPGQSAGFIVEPDGRIMPR